MNIYLAQLLFRLIPIALLIGLLGFLFWIGAGTGGKIFFVLMLFFYIF